MLTLLGGAGRQALPCLRTVQRHSSSTFHLLRSSSPFNHPSISSSFSVSSSSSSSFSSLSSSSFSPSSSSSSSSSSPSFPSFAPFSSLSLLSSPSCPSVSSPSSFSSSTINFQLSSPIFRPNRFSQPGVFGMKLNRPLQDSLCCRAFASSSRASAGDEGQGTKGSPSSSGKRGGAKRQPTARSSKSGAAAKSAAAEADKQQPNTAGKVRTRRKRSESSVTFNAANFLIDPVSTDTEGHKPNHTSISSKKAPVRQSAKHQSSSLSENSSSTPTSTSKTDDHPKTTRSSKRRARLLEQETPGDSYSQMFEQLFSQQPPSPTSPITTPPLPPSTPDLSISPTSSLSSSLSSSSSSLSSSSLSASPSSLSSPASSTSSSSFKKSIKRNEGGKPIRLNDDNSQPCLAAEPDENETATQENDDIDDTESKPKSKSQKKSNSDDDDDGDDDEDGIDADDYNFGFDKFDEADDYENDLPQFDDDIPLEHQSSDRQKSVKVPIEWDRGPQSTDTEKAFEDVVSLKIKELLAGGDPFDPREQPAALGSGLAEQMQQQESHAIAKMHELALARQGNLVAEVRDSIAQPSARFLRISTGLEVLGYARAKDIYGACTAVENAHKKNVEVDIITYTNLILAYYYAGQYKKAWETFSYIRSISEETQPDEVLFTLMIFICAKQHRVERALNFKEEMINDGLFPTEITYNALIQAASSRKDYYETTFHLVQEMKAAGYVPDRATYASLLRACAMQGDIQGSKQVLAAAETNGVAISLPFLALHMRALAIAAYRASPDTCKRSINAADQLWEMMQERPDWAYLPYVYNSYLEVFTSSLRIKRAELVFAQFQKHNVRHNVQTYLLMLRMYMRFKKLTTAEDYFRRMLAESVAPDSRIYHTMICGFARANWFRSALRYLHEMINMGFQPKPKHTLLLARKTFDFPHIRTILGLMLKQAGIVGVNSQRYFRPRKKPSALFTRQKGGELGALKLALQTTGQKLGMGLEHTQELDPPLYRYNRPNLNKPFHRRHGKTKSVKKG